MSTATYCHVPATAENTAVVGGLGALAPLGAARPPQTTPVRASTATTAKQLPKKKFATKQAKNRELNRRKKLAKHHRSGAKHTPETIERIRASRQAQEREREAARLEEAQRVVAPVVSPAVQLYRETKALRLPVIKARDAEIIEAVKRTVAEADARADEMRHRGRPKKKALPPIFIRRGPDALIAAVSDWHGER